MFLRRAGLDMSPEAIEQNNGMPDLGKLKIEDF